MSDPNELLLANTRALIAGFTGIGGQGCFVWNPTTGKMLAGGDRLAELLGYPSEEEIEQLAGRWGALVHPEDRPISNRMMNRLRRASANTFIADRLRVLRKDGRWDVVHISQRVLERGRKGKLLATVGLCQVITSYVVPYEEVVKREALYRQIVDEAGDGIFLCDQRGSIYYANRCLERFLGFKKGELRGQTVWQVFELRKGGKRVLDLGQLDRKGTPRLLCRARCIGGGQMMMDLRVRRLDKERFLGIARDMTREMQLAESNRQQAAYYRGLFLNNTSGVAVLGEDLRISASNRALSLLLKQPSKQLEGRPLIDFVAPEAQPEARHIFARMQRDPKFNSAYRNGVKLSLITKDGAVVLVQAALTAIVDEENDLRQGIAIFTDITEEQRYRQERDDEAQFNKALLAHASAAIMVSDPEGRIIDVNPAVEKLTGFKRQQLIGKHGWASGLLDEEQARSSRSRLQELLDGAAQVNSTLRIYTRQGGIRIVETQSTAARRPNGEIACIIITAMDVTEQKRLEHEVIKVAEQEQMRIGHDLHDGVGQVLTGIMSLTEALECSLTGESQKEAARIRELVREAITQVRQLSHGLSPAAVKHRGLAASLRLLAESIRSSRLQCHCNISWEPQFNHVEAETHLFRIAQEAVTNAIRHGKPTKITLSLHCESGQTGLMEIEDNGVGFRARKQASAEGIGIRVMRYRAALIGGEFQITRQEEGGTRVRCRFSCVF